MRRITILDMELVARVNSQLCRSKLFNQPVATYTINE